MLCRTMNRLHYILLALIHPLVAEREANKVLGWFPLYMVVYNGHLDVARILTRKVSPRSDDKQMLLLPTCQ